MKCNTSPLLVLGRFKLRFRKTSRAKCECNTSPPLVSLSLRMFRTILHRTFLDSLNQFILIFRSSKHICYRCLARNARCNTMSPLTAAVCSLDARNGFCATVDCVPHCKRTQLKATSKTTPAFPKCMQLPNAAAATRVAPRFVMGGTCLKPRLRKVDPSP